MAPPRVARLTLLAAVALAPVSALAGSVQVNNTAVTGVVVRVAEDTGPGTLVDAAGTGSVAFQGAVAELRVSGEGEASCSAFVSDGGTLMVFGSVSGGITCSAQ